MSNTLQSVRDGLSQELAKETAKRDALQAQLDVASSKSERASLQTQIAKVDENIAKLNEGIDKIGSRALPAVAGGLSAGTAPPYGGPPWPANAIPTTMIVSVVALVFVGFPLAIAFARLLWRRASHVGAPASAQLPADATRRFDHLEQSVDAIAIEIERISENQRYLTKLLSEPRPVEKLTS